MTRSKGSRNADYDARRAELVARLHKRLADRTGGAASLRDLAAAAGVSVPTLSHYFGRREEIVTAVLAALGESGEPHLAAAAQPGGPFPTSIRQLLSEVADGHRFGVGAIHTVGLTEGLGNERIGPDYVNSILEPTLQAVERRLAAHIALGEMRQTDARHAALALIAPAVLALLHQNELGGGTCRPLDLEKFLDEHAQAFVRANRAEVHGTPA